jgi:hypothetical protein
LQHLTIVIDSLFLQLLLCSIDKPRGVKLFVL